MLFVKESFGGAFMLKMVLVFIVIYVSFMAVAVNYAKAFRVKNNVINILEQSQFVISTDDFNEIDEYLNKVPYNLNGNSSVKNDCSNIGFDNKNSSKTKGLTQNGVCITKVGTNTDFYYRVTTYISIEFPFFDISMTLPINGETKMISVQS